MILTTLRVPPPLLAPGTIESTSAHVASLIPRLRLLNRQSHDAERKLEALTVRLVAAEETEPGQKKQHDALTLVSLPGVGRTILATLLAEAWEPLQRRDYAALLSLTGVAPVTKRSAKVASSCVGKLARTASPTPSTTGRVSPCSAILEPAANTSNFGAEAHSRQSPAIRRRPPAQVACAMLKSGATFQPLAPQKAA